MPISDEAKAVEPGHRRGGGSVPVSGRCLPICRTPAVNCWCHPRIDPAVVGFRAVGEEPLRRMIFAAANSRKAGRLSGADLHAIRDQLPQQLPAASEATGGRRLVSLPLDPIRFPLDDGIPMLPAFGGQVIDPLRTGYGFHDSGLDQLPVGGEIPFIRRPPLALRMETKHGDGQLGQRRRPSPASRLPRA